jgi:hypothetical protein
MPSNLPLPTIRGLVGAASNAIVGKRDEYGDVISGSLYNHASGPTAVIFSREADRDKNLFEDIYFNSATGDALTEYVQAKFGIARVLDSYGAGTCSFSRPTTTAGGGSFLQGTRIQIQGNPPTIVEISVDTAVPSASLLVTIPIRSIVTGSGVAIQASSGLTLLDPIYDNTWTPKQLQCGDGSDFESASDFRARVIQDRINEETGYIPQIVLACQNAGAAYVITFPSQYGLEAGDFFDDFGLNALYVADSNYQSPPSLVAACSSVLEGWRVLGADLLVGGVSNVILQINILVSLTDSPSKLPTQSIKRSILQAILGSFGPTDGGDSFSIDAIGGTVSNASTYVQTAFLPRTWQAETIYPIGYLVYAAGGVQQCTQSGESGLSVPAFSPVSGFSVFDGSAAWTCTAYPSTGLFANGVLQTADSTLSPQAWPSSLPRYSLGSMNINIQFIGPV